ncbi:MAG: protein kinase [Pirellulaceae bacterium]|nr:protein kinase [Pirellulaceae bacterium]
MSYHESRSRPAGPEFDAVIDSVSESLSDAMSHAAGEAVSEAPSDADSHARHTAMVNPVTVNKDAVDALAPAVAKPITDSVINECLDDFDADWEPTGERLKAVVERSGLLSDPLAVSELVRADIDRRYTAGVPVALTDYLSWFPQLFHSSEALTSIAFEDFRARRSRGLECQPDRWSWLSPARHAAWFVELEAEFALEDSPTPNASSIALPLESKGSADSRFTGNQVVDAASGLQAVDEEPEIGKSFGDFHLICLLGSGTFSRVYLALQTSIASRYVALKVVRRTLSEPMHLARMQHTGIIPLFSFHRIGQYSVMCMPYTGAATLADWLKHTQYAHQTTSSALQSSPARGSPVRGSQKSPHGSSRHSDSSRNGQSLIETVEATQSRLTANSDTFIGDQDADNRASRSQEIAGKAAEHLRRWDAATRQPLYQLARLSARELPLWLACRLASALAHAHARGIIHGDLKPANVLIRNDGEPALIDFNLSHSDDVPVHDWVGGTLPYMAPEQLQALLGRRTVLSASSDIYALGVMLFELMEGKLPFLSAVSTAECDLLKAIDSRRNENVRFNDSVAHGGYRAIIERCLAYDAADRYQDAGQLLEDLEAERANQRLQYAREPLTSRLMKTSRRYPRVFSASVVSSVALVCTLAVAALGVSWYQRSQVLSSREQATQLDKQFREFVPQLLDASGMQAVNTVQRIPEMIQSSLRFDAGEPVPTSSTYRWLSPSDQQVLSESIFDHCLCAAVLLMERAPHTAYGQAYQPATDQSIQESVQQMLSLCEQFPHMGHSSLLLNHLTKQTAEDLRARQSVSPAQVAAQGDNQRDDQAGAVRNVQAAGLQVPTAVGSRGAAETLLSARVVLNRGNAKQALAKLSSMGKDRFHDYLFWMTAAEAQLQIGEPQAAKMSYTLAIEAAPRVAGGYAGRAQAELALADYASAQADLTHAIEVSDEKSAHLAQRALVLERTKEYQAALDDINQALSHNRNSNRLLLIRSRLLRRLGESDQAQLDLQQALSQQPTSADDWVARGLARATNEPDQALADLQAALALEPNSPAVLQNIAYVQSELLHDDPAAVKSLDKILEMRRDHEAARGGRCVLVARAGDAEAAIADIEYLRETFDKPLPVTIYQMGCAHALLAKTRPASRQAAIRLLLRALQQGYGSDLIADDPDLDALRNEKRFKDLVDLSEGLFK